MDFETAFDVIVEHEGGFSNDPRDSGNWTGGEIGAGVLAGTKYGVSSKSFPKLDIKNLTLLDAMGIYKNLYWDAMCCDEMPRGIRLDLFDAAVNIGVKSATILLQRSVGVGIDGFIGPVTIEAAHGMSPATLDKYFSANRLLYLCSLGDFPRFGRGWVRRIAHNMLND